MFDYLGKSWMTGNLPSSLISILILFIVSIIININLSFAKVHQTNLGNRDKNHPNFPESKITIELNL